jgi:tocopherol O-methyltransferase
MLIFGRGRREGAIHRCVWAPGIKSRSEAILYVNRLVSNAISPLISESYRNINVLDLGCGVGGTAVWLAKLFDLKIIGITISRIQADLARKNALKKGVKDRCTFIHGDFLNLPDIENIDAAFAIESFSHARDPYLFFSQLTNRLSYGNRLIICDDFLGELKNHTYSKSREKWVDRFRNGWRLKSLLSVDQVNKIAKIHGFRMIRQNNLTPYLRITPYLGLEVIFLLTRLPFDVPYKESLYGGAALQICLKRGWVEYHFLVFEKL